MTFDDSLAAFVLDRVRTTDLPSVALQGLEEGYDSVELAALAGSSPERAPSELLDAWGRARREIGKALPSRAEAGRRLCDHYATRVASGSLSPREGATEIVRIVTALVGEVPDRRYVGDGLGVETLVGLHYHGDVRSDDDGAHH